MASLQILADENIAQVHEAFGRFGELRTMPGRAITAEAARDCDILLVRSVTRVDASLLAGSRCRFVGTATSGTDHVQSDWLQQQGIHFADAHGCNAAGVVDYVLAAVAWLALRDARDWLQASCGIVGCGAVGSRLVRRLLALGLPLRIYDPFLPASHPLAAHFAPLEEVLQQDIVTLHVPLTTDGRWPTRHMLDAARLALLRPDAILVNAARGAVLDSQALLQQMQQHAGLRVVLDAWEGEPVVNQQLLQQVDLGTPHIAGYSRLGKLRGTHMLLQALGRFLQLPQLSLPGPAAPPPLQLSAADDRPLWQQVATALLAAYDVQRDHAVMQEALCGLEPADSAREFDRLRKQYPERREFGEFRLEGGQEALQRALLACGFAGS